MHILVSFHFTSRVGTTCSFISTQQQHSSWLQKCRWTAKLQEGRLPQTFCTSAFVSCHKTFGQPRKNFRNQTRWVWSPCKIWLLFVIKVSVYKGGPILWRGAGVLQPPGIWVMLDPLKTILSQMCYHAKFGHSRSNGIRAYVGRPIRKMEHLAYHLSGSLTCIRTDRLIGYQWIRNSDP